MSAVTVPRRGSVTSHSVPTTASIAFNFFFFYFKSYIRKFPDLGSVFPI